MRFIIVFFTLTCSSIAIAQNSKCNQACDTLFGRNVNTLEQLYKHKIVRGYLLDQKKYREVFSFCYFLLDYNLKANLFKYNYKERSKLKEDIEYLKNWRANNPEKANMEYFCKKANGTFFQCDENRDNIWYNVPHNGADW